MAKAKKKTREPSKERTAAIEAGRAAQIPFGQRVQSLRKQHGLTQTQVADKLDLSQKYISELEGGHKSPSYETMVGLAKIVFGISLSALVFGIDDPAHGELHRLEDLLAGRSKEAQANILHAMQLLLAVPA